MRNRVELRSISPGGALDALATFYGDYTPETAALAPQLALSRNLRALKINGRIVMIGGLVPAGSHHEGYLIIDPHWTPTPRLMLPVVRRLRAAVGDAARGRALIVHAATGAGARLAKMVHLQYLRRVRLHGNELEVWGVVSAQDHWRAVEAEAGGATG